jgi:2-methylisocitrate lyase-like PEP mutase family enzyme
LLESSSQHEQDSIEAFCEKIKVGQRHRITEDFMIIARIESLILGKSMQDALERAKAYIRAGVDGIMIHSKSAEPREILEFAEEYKSIEDKVPLVAVPTTYNSIHFEELSAAGFNIVVYANHLLRSAYPAMISTARSILENKRSLEAEPTLEPVSGLLTLIPGNL